MPSVLVALVTFACCLGGALVGMRLRQRGKRPPAPEKKGSMATGALVVTMVALVLGLLAVTKNSFDEVDATVRRIAEGLLAVDRALADYGADAQRLRARLRGAASERFDGLTSPQGAASLNAKTPSPSSIEEVVDDIRGLQPQDDRQRALQARALEQAEALSPASWSTLETGPRGTSALFIALVVIWLAATFASFGLYRRSATAALAGPLIGALAAAGALFLIIEFATPHSGAFRVSDEPLRRAINMMNLPPR